jgi:acyl dehydratase
MGLVTKRLVFQVREILGELVDGLKEQHLELNLEKMHEERVVHGLYLLSMLNQASLHKLYLELKVGTSYQRETLRFVM